jgi:CheY-like chemotaxis protein
MAHLPTEPAGGRNGAGNEPCDSVDTLPVLPKRPGVLVADAEARIRILLRVTLREHGFVVFLADGASEAVKLYRNHHGDIELVLLDVALPELDGPTTLRALQEINPEVRCCFLTPTTGPCQKAELLGLGAVRIFTKSFGPQGLVQSLWSLVHDTDRPPGLSESDSGLEVPDEAPVPERRASPRYACLRDHLCRPASGPWQVTPWKGRLADVSAVGARFLLEHELEVGDLVTLRLPPGEAPDSAPLLARVVRVERAADGRWSLACIFTNKLTESQLREWVG